MTIQLPQDFIDQLNSTSDSEGISLPFTAPIVWWNHGNKQMKHAMDIRYFGGWASDGDEFYKAIGEFGAVPGGFVEGVFDGRDGEYNVYQSRAVVVAPIATRFRWTRRPNEKPRSHAQKLCMMAMQKDNVLIPWGPIVLSAKGLTTRELQRVDKEFDALTLDVRREIAPDVPSLYFWRSIGTYGNEPMYAQAGSGQTSTVTYPILYPFKEITTESVERWFVGQDTAAEMVRLKAEAKEWLNDKLWKQSKDETTEEQEDVDPYLPGGFMDNDVPF